LGLLIGGAILTFNYYREPILAFIAKPTIDFSWINNLTLDSILAFITKYGALFSLAGLGITFIYGVYQKHQANKAALQLVAAQQNANSEINTAYGAAETYRQQAETYKLQIEQAGKNDLGESLREAQNQVVLKELDIKKLQNQLEALNNIVLLKDTKVIEKTVVK
jgi:hypothetical protein